MTVIIVKNQLVFSSLQMDRVMVTQVAHLIKAEKE